MAMFNNCVPMVKIYNALTLCIDSSKQLWLYNSIRHDGDPLPASTTPAVCVLSNHGSPVTASPGLPISRWWSRVSPVLSQHCATGKGASSPVHAAVVAPRSDWTALRETSSGEHPCRHDNLPISQQGCVCGVGWGSSAWLHPCLRLEHDNDSFYIIVTSRLAFPL